MFHATKKETLNYLVQKEIKKKEITLPVMCDISLYK
jgi:hypothetical protein